MLRRDSRTKSESGNSSPERGEDLAASDDKGRTALARRKSAQDPQDWPEAMETGIQLSSPLVGGNLDVSFQNDLWRSPANSDNQVSVQRALIEVCGAQSNDAPWNARKLCDRWIKARRRQAIAGPIFMQQRRVKLGLVNVMLVDDELEKELELLVKRDQGKN